MFRRWLTIVIFSSLSTLVMAQWADPYVEGEVLVKFKPGSQISAMAENTRLGAQVMEIVGGVGVSRLKLPRNMSVAQAVNHYGKLPFVEFAEPNFYLQLFFTPNDPSWNLQWGPQKIQCPQAWDINQGHSSVRIGIIDTGISTSHPDLASKVVAGYNHYNNNSNWNDGFGHGSHCAGIAAAITNNGIGVAGVGFNCSLLAGKAFSDSGSGTITTAANAINWAVSNGAKVLSMSFGFSSGSSTLSNAINNAWNSGCIPIAAAGNTGNTAILYPAGYANCMSVGASTSNDGKASWSTYGSNVDVAAPGVSIYSCWSGTSYAYSDGTSMACPHVAGIAGLVWSHFGTNQSTSFVRSQIEQNCDNVGGWVANGWCKYGRVNAYKALLGGGVIEKDHAPNFVDRVFGEKRGGNLASLISSDNNYWWMTGIKPNPAADAKIEWYCTSLMSYTGNLQKVDVTIEANCIVSNQMVKLYLINWNSGDLEYIGQANLTSSDSTQTFTITTGLNNYVSGGEILAYFAMAGPNLIEMKTDMVKFKTYSQ